MLLNFAHRQLEAFVDGGKLDERGRPQTWYLGEDGSVFHELIIYSSMDVRRVLISVPPWDWRTEAAAQLEKEGLVENLGDNDHYQSLIRLTDAGWAAAQIIPERQTAVMMLGAQSWWPPPF